MTNQTRFPSIAWRSLFCCWLWIMLVACIPTPTPPTTPTPVRSGDEDIAVVTYLTGNVTLLDTGRAVKAFQVLKEGSRLNVAVDTKATVICFQERWFAVDEPGEVDVTQQCANAAPLPANTAQLVKPDGGRIVLIEGSLALEEQARERESDYGNIPIILSPRNTSLLDFASEISWVAVEGALEYQLGLSGLASFDNVILNASEVTCADELDVPGSRVCATAWPAAWTLEPGQRYFLTVSARTGIAAPLRESEVSALRTLDQEQAKGVQDEINKIQELALDENMEALLLAPIYVTNNLNTLAISAYIQVVNLQPTPLTYVALGDLYREINLQRYAFVAYQHSLDLLDASEDNLLVRAAAEFGIGQVYYAQQNFDEAEKHFEFTVEIYRHVAPVSGRIVQLAEDALIEAESR